MNETWEAVPQALTDEEISFIVKRVMKHAPAILSAERRIRHKRDKLSRRLWAKLGVKVRP